jgi:hypothetical protein
MGKNLGAEFPPEDVELIRRVANARGESVSSFLRMVVRSELARLNLLSDFDMKALAIGKENESGAGPGESQVQSMAQGQGGAENEMREVINGDNTSNR